jgi:predicted RNase H-like nuclease
MRAAQAWPLRVAACDELIDRAAGLVERDPPMNLRSHPATLALIETPSPASARLYKQREDLLDAAICAWSAALWHKHGLQRSQILGAAGQQDPEGRRATIIAPARDGQRRHARP